MRSILGLLLLCSVAIGCGWDKIDPRATAPTPDNPCGNIGVTCLDMQGKPSGFCCDDGETCGGGKYSVGCPAGECCDIRMPPAFLQWQEGSDAAVREVGTDAGPTAVVKRPQTRRP